MSARTRGGSNLHRWPEEECLGAHTSNPAATWPRRFLAVLEWVLQENYALAGQELEIGLFVGGGAIRNHRDMMIMTVCVLGLPELSSNEHLPESMGAIREMGQWISMALDWPGSTRKKTASQSWVGLYRG